MTVLISGFNKRQKQLWNEFAKEFNGSILDGGKYNGDTLLFKHKTWTIVLDECLKSNGESSFRVTRMRVPIVNETGLCFKIFREDWFLKILKIFGTKDIQIGDPGFDKQFMIEGNQESMIQQLLSSKEIKELLLKMARANFTLRNDEERHGDEFPDGVDLLEVDIVGKVDEMSSLMTMAKLLVAACNKLEALESSFAKDPKVNLI